MSIQNTSSAGIKPVDFSFKISGETVPGACEIKYNEAKYADSRNRDHDIVNINMKGFSSFCQSIIKNFYFYHPLNLTAGKAFEKDGENFRAGNVVLNADLKYIRISEDNLDITVDYVMTEGFNLPGKMDLVNTDPKALSKTAALVSYQVENSIPVPTKFQVSVQENGANQSRVSTFDLSDCKMVKYE
jgi:hypothetical protein